MSRRRRNSQLNNTSSSDEATTEIDLSPLLALMVTLIPVMLLATVFVRITIIESALPQVVKNAIEEDRKKKDREVSINLYLEQQGYRLDVTVDGKKTVNQSIAKKGADYNISALHEAFVKVKVVHPKVFRVELFPQPDVPYEEIVRVIDEARETKEGDPKIYLKDSETNKAVETKIMFPDVIFSNVMEG